MQIMGSAISGEGFFCLEFAEDVEEERPVDQKVSNVAITSMDPGKLNLRILRQELKTIVIGEWDWQVT